MADTIKIVYAMMDKIIETHKTQEQLLPLVTYEEPDPAMLQNAGDVYWKPVQQHAPLQQGWDMTGNETDIIEEGCPYIMSTPWNDVVKQRIDKIRDDQFFMRRAEEAGRKIASKQNYEIANAIATQGSLFYRSNDTSAWDFITNAQVKMNERQSYQSERYFTLNDRDTQKFGKDLSARQTINEIPRAVWNSGMLQKQVAQFSVYTGSYLPNLTGGANPGTTVTANVSEKPLGGTVTTATGIVQNFDWRTATIAVTASAGYNIGDKVTFSNGGTPVYAIGLMDKTVTTDPMQFTIVAKPTGTSVTVYPKPIALDDAALSTLEKAYANINTQILNTATMDRVNIDASNQTNLFWDKSAVTVSGGSLPVEMFKEWGGMKVVKDSFVNGQPVYLLYDGDILEKNFRFVIFSWWGVTVNNPSNCGCAVSYT